MKKLMIILLLAAVGLIGWWLATRSEPGVSGLPELSTPRPNQLIESPLRVAGRAPGPWFFEASLPVRLVDANGRQVAISAAQALEDWMTTGYVSFEGTLVFDQVSTATGTLVIAKDNPSGLPENDASFAIPIRFSEP